jgi:hypothetical protein
MWKGHRSADAIKSKKLLFSHPAPHAWVYAEYIHNGSVMSPFHHLINPFEYPSSSILPPLAASLVLYVVSPLHSAKAIPFRLSQGQLNTLFEPLPP